MNKKFFAVLAAVCFISLPALAQTIYMGPANKKNINLDELKSFNLVLLSGENGVYKYAGNEDGISLSFDATEREVTSVNLMYPQSENEVYLPNAAATLRKLMPKRFTDTNNLEKKMNDKIKKLKKERDSETLRTQSVKFEFKLMGGMIHITAIQ